MATARMVRPKTRGWVRWEWLSLAAVPIGALVTDRHLPAPWVGGLSFAAGTMVLLAFEVPQRVWGGTTRALVDHIQRDLEERESDHAMRLLGARADALQEMIDAYTPARGVAFVPLPKKRQKKQALLAAYERERTEVMLAIDEAISAGALDRGAKLTSEDPRGVGDLTALLAALRRMMLELNDAPSSG